MLRQNTGGFDRFIMDYIRGQGDSNKTANETGIIDTGERTPDGKKQKKMVKDLFKLLIMPKLFH